MGGGGGHLSHIVQGNLLQRVLTGTMCRMDTQIINRIVACVQQYESGALSVKCVDRHNPTVTAQPATAQCQQGV